MPNFTYRAKTIEGIEHQGEIESADPHTAAIILRKRGLVVISIAPKSSMQYSSVGRIFDRAKFSDVVNTTRQLATMVSAGLVLSESVDILAEQQDRGRLKDVLSSVSRDIKGGLTLSQSLGRYPDVFPMVYTNLVKAGEASGKLDEILLKMADSLERQREFQSRVRGAMIYPAVVVTMMLGVVLVMMVFVIPKLTDLYSQSSMQLPLPTKILIGLSNFTSHFWYLVIGMLVLSAYIFRKWVQKPEGKLAFDTMILKIPLIGKLVKLVNMTDFARTMGLLVASGVPLLESINIVSEVTQNGVFKNSLKTAYGGVMKGLTFSDQIANLPVFPRIVSQMVRVGEETGKVDVIFFKLADYFESESDHMVKNLTVAIEPIIIVILGIGVAFLVISIILPIYQLTTSFGGQ